MRPGKKGRVREYEKGKVKGRGQERMEEEDNMKKGVERKEQKWS